MKTGCIFNILLILGVACYVKAEDCEFIEEFEKGGRKVINVMLTGHKDLEPILGCWKAMCTGDITGCDPKHFDIPQFPSCNKCIKDDKFESKAKECNLKQYESVIDNFLAAEDLDTDELCLKIPAFANQAIDAYKNYLEGGPDQAKESMDKFCAKDPETCKQMEAFPKLFASKFGVCFEDFFKAAKGTAKSKGMVLSSSALKGISLMFGGDKFGDAVSECVTEGVSSLGKGKIG